MHFTKKNSSEKRIGLKNKLKEKNILRFPGAYNPLTAKLISEIGFDKTGSSPTIIGICEVENRFVVEDLINTGKLKEINYNIACINFY